MFLLLICPKCFAYIWAWKISTCYLLLFCGIVVKFNVTFLEQCLYIFSNKEHEYEYEIDRRIAEVDIKFMYTKSNAFGQNSYKDLHLINCSNLVITYVFFK